MDYFKGCPFEIDPGSAHTIVIDVGKVVFELKLKWPLSDMVTLNIEYLAVAP